MGWFSDLTGISTPDWVKDAGDVIANPTLAFLDAQAGAATGIGALTPGGQTVQTVAGSSPPDWLKDAGDVLLNPQVAFLDAQAGVASGSGAQTPGGEVLQPAVEDAFGLVGMDNTGNTTFGRHTITNEPWAAIQPSLLQAVAATNTATFNDAGGLNLPGYIGPGENTVGGLKAMAAGPSDYLNTAGDFYGQLMQGGSNPYLDRQFGKASSAVRQKLDSQFASAGRYGSDAHQNVMSDAYNDLATNIYGGAYESDMGRRMQGLGMAPGLDSALAQTAARQYQAGTIQDSIKSDAQNYTYDTSMDMLGKYLAAINAAGGTYGSQTQPVYENKMANTAGLLAGLGSFAGGVGALF